MKRAWLLALLLAAGGCSVAIDAQPLGDTEGQPLTLLSARGDVYEIGLQKPAHVTVLGLRPGRDRYPVIFRALYPERPGDQWQFPAGRARVPPVGARRGPPFNADWCKANETPTLDGCRYRNGVPAMFEQGGPSLNYVLLIASDEPIDPFRAAYELTLAAYEDDALTEAIRSSDRGVVRRAVEQALANRRGTPFWSAVLVRR